MNLECNNNNYNDNHNQLFQINVFFTHRKINYAIYLAPELMNTVD